MHTTNRARMLSLLVRASEENTRITDPEKAAAFGISNRASARARAMTPCPVIDIVNL
jgi:hypothetical protein